MFLDAKGSYNKSNFYTMSKVSVKKKLTDWFYFKVIGSNGIDVFYLDSFLSLFEDGQPRDQLPTFTGNLVWAQSRIEEKLINDGYLKPWGYHSNGFIITSEGKLHLERGGYRKELLYKKLNRFSFWLSLLATILSVIAVIRSF